ncbi:urease accessory protein UreD [Micromonospora sp. MW-13]|uniref:urease accessory protein UreD n=1 Tax=Micromonospora sp. MW-13 TaxID=2094022 RepID=UPI001FB3FD7D|nr:urease accessory protein UreD [Micromonospora sp. MW-13]
MDVDLAPGSQAHVVTQAATKIQEMDANHGSQIQTCTLASDTRLGRRDAAGRRRQPAAERRRADLQGPRAGSGAGARSDPRLLRAAREEVTGRTFPPASSWR